MGCSGSYRHVTRSRPSPEIFWQAHESPHSDHANLHRLQPAEARQRLLPELQRSAVLAVPGMPPDDREGASTRCTRTRQDELRKAGRTRMTEASRGIVQM